MRRASPVRAAAHLAGLLAALVAGIATAQVAASRLPGEVLERVAARQARWAAMGADARDALRARAAAWDALPAAERGDRREAYRAWRALSGPERDALAAAAARLSALGADEQAALRAQFDALDGAERRGWRLGPSLGADYAALQPLLAQVPPHEHQRLLRALRAMEPLQRRRL
ncbi:MAG: DUF3106 domain-containing protein, partial [Pseudomonas sp.]|nr:DUF3106 domain-containing protein [Pseudomonas sp.]